jgi:diguanylate cyclase (GGDEF)-like protein
MLISGELKLKKWDKLLLVPIAVCVILTLLSPRFKLLFYIDGANVYHRGAYFYIAAAITYFYLLYGLMVIIKNRKKMVAREYTILLMFGILPIFGGAVQTLFYGVLFMWSGAAFSFVILFIFLQQRMVQLDDLTGAWNRSSFESYMSASISQEGSVKKGIIYADIDDLKQINDKFGHLEGDFAIKAAVEAIRSVIRKSDMVVRMGGDEFVIVLEGGAAQAIGTTVGRMEAALEAFNQTSGKSYRLDCSFGADMFDSKCNSIDQFLHHIDCLMYENKKTKK